MNDLTDRFHRSAGRRISDREIVEMMSSVAALRPEETREVQVEMAVNAFADGVEALRLLSPEETRRHFDNLTLSLGQALRFVNTGASS